VSIIIILRIVCTRVELTCRVSKWNLETQRNFNPSQKFCTGTNGDCAQQVFGNERFLVLYRGADIQAGGIAGSYVFCFFVLACPAPYRQTPKKSCSSWLFCPAANIVSMARLWPHSHSSYLLYVIRQLGYLGPVARCPLCGHKLSGVCTLQERSISRKCSREKAHILGKSVCCVYFCLSPTSSRPEGSDEVQIAFDAICTLSPSAVGVHDTQ
jgi:hypothetical protein